MAKVLLINGSPREKGCTYTALCEMEKTLNKNGIETELFQLGAREPHDCIACGQCGKSGRCVFNDAVNELAARADEFSGMVVGSPVYYAGPSSSVTGFLDRLFYSAGGRFKNKPACCIVSCRRGGASAAFDRLNKYFQISNMPVVSSQYWNQVHGNTPEEVMRDIEGMQTVRTLAQNMAWLIRCIEAGKAAGIEPPVHEPKTATNFIR